jgi:hypothetical protein
LHNLRSPVRGSSAPSNSSGAQWAVFRPAPPDSVSFRRMGGSRRLGSASRTVLRRCRSARDACGGGVARAATGAAGRRVVRPGPALRRAGPCGGCESVGADGCRPGRQGLGRAHRQELGGARRQRLGRAHRQELGRARRQRLGRAHRQELGPARHAGRDGTPGEEGQDAGSPFSPSGPFSLSGPFSPSGP